MLDGIIIGLSTAVMPFNLMMVVVGCFAGTFIGMLPGLGPISAVALMIPITYGLDPSSSIILMAGVYYGAVFGASTSSILINAPGCAATTLHPVYRETAARASALRTARCPRSRYRCEGRQTSRAPVLATYNKGCP